MWLIPQLTAHVTTVAMHLGWVQNKFWLFQVSGQSSANVPMSDKSLAAKQ